MTASKTTRHGLTDRRYNGVADDLIEQMHRSGHSVAAIHAEALRQGMPVSTSLVYARVRSLRIAEEAAK